MSAASREEIFSVPILFIIFNRAETTKVVFDMIKTMRPSRLYIAADGPRKDVDDDRDKCEQTRRIVDDVDWPCDVKLRFSNENLGCGKGPATAITWFFSHEPEGIILEDDCLPSRSFFGYCKELLERYRNDTRVMHIGGNNFISGRVAEHSYYFSYNGHIWGWATWRRAWAYHDLTMSRFKELKRSGAFNRVFLNGAEKLYRLRKFSQVTNGEIITWDYQWDFARLIQSGLAIVPAVNLVRNIGFGFGATHTHDADNPNGKMYANEIALPLKHPLHVHRCFTSDKKYFMTLMRERIMSKLQII